MQLPKISILYLVSSIKYQVLSIKEFAKKYTKYQILNTKYGKSKGFTLVELLIVISIIAILVAAGTYSWQNAQAKARDGRRKQDLKEVQKALELYFQNNGKYPDYNAGQIKCNLTSPPDTTTIAWGSAFTCGSINYMQQLPKDPLSKSQTDGYYYFVTPPNPKTYSLSAKLENSNDPDSQNQPSDCIPGGDGRNYCVTNP